MTNKDLLEKLFADRKKKLEERIINTILSAFNRDLPVHDFSYIERRSKEVIEEMMKGIDFSNDSIDHIRREFLEHSLQRAKKALPKPKEFRKKTKDLTEIRDGRCEPAVFEIIESLLDPELLLTDYDYIHAAVKDQSRLLLEVILMGYLDTFFSQLEIVINSHLRDATEKLWGDKPKEAITMRDLDKILKSKKVLPTEEKTV